MVIRYDYLWKDEYRRGRLEGGKDRPCAIVIATTDGVTHPYVVVAPITHSPPVPGTAAVEIPAKVKKHLGLDDDPSWIITGDLNRLRWDDPGIVPASRTKWDYGALPQPLVERVQEQIAAQARQRTISMLDRERIEKQRDHRS
jgi:hypothetical protein